MEQLIQTGQVRYAWLGVTTQTRDAARSPSDSACRRTRARPSRRSLDGSPADRAGLRGGKGEEPSSRACRSARAATSSSPSTASPSTRRRTLSALSTSSASPGDEIRLTVLRGGERRDLTVDPRRPAGERRRSWPASASRLAGCRRPARIRSSSGTTWRSSRRFDDGSLPARLRRPALQHRAEAAPADPRDRGGRPTATGPGSAGAATRPRVLGESSFADSFDDYLGFLEPRLRELRRLLAPTGTLYLHLDYREAHYAKVLLDGLFGRECFLNEIVWAYDYGARPRRRWPAKHDTILVYVKDPGRYWFDAEAVEREPYMAPGPGDGGEGRAREAADRRLVAHDRLADRKGEDRLPDPEAGGDPAAHGAGVHAARRLVPRSRSPGSGTLGGGLRRSSAAASSSSIRAPRRSRSPGSASRGFAAPEARGTCRGRTAIPELVPAGARFRQIRSRLRHHHACDRELESQRAWSLSSSRRRPSTSLSGGWRSAGLLRPLAVEPEVIADVKLALTEACSNSIRHAYDGRARRRGRDPLRAGRSSLAVEVSDEGGGFDPGAARGRSGELDEGGLGIAIIRARHGRPEHRSRAPAGPAPASASRSS